MSKIRLDITQSNSNTIPLATICVYFCSKKEQINTQIKVREEKPFLQKAKTNRVFNLILFFSTFLLMDLIRTTKSKINIYFRWKIVNF